MSTTRVFVLFLLVILATTLSEAVPFIVRQDGEFVPDMSAEPSVSPSMVSTDDDESQDEALGDASPESVEPSGEFQDETAQSSPEGEEQCIDARYLAKFSHDNLVHAESVMADVFCPAHESLPCGTADHVIVVRGSPTSYREYCQTTECAKSRMKVNSVLSHLWNDEHHAGDIKLTMLDGRHPAALQRVLHRMIAPRRAWKNVI